MYAVCAVNVHNVRPHVQLKTKIYICALYTTNKPCVVGTRAIPHHKILYIKLRLDTKVLCTQTIIYIYIMVHIPSFISTYIYLNISICVYI